MKEKRALLTASPKTARANCLTPSARSLTGTQRGMWCAFGSHRGGGTCHEKSFQACQRVFLLLLFVFEAGSLYVVILTVLEL